MRIALKYTVVASVCCLVLLSLMIICVPRTSEVWKAWDQIVAFFSAAGTLVAGVAAMLAAKEAANSAYIARQSMEASLLSAQETLNEARSFNKLSRFENRFAVLLEQHNQYHLQVCEYLDSGLTPGQVADEINQFFKDSRRHGGLEQCLSFLTGHEIISRYMRTLYHLLKYVKDEFYVDGNAKRLMKNYTSPLRATIRNDVLYLIAVNALNVISPGAILSGYPRYQALLHEFDFFEHAVFTEPHKPNSITFSEQVSWLMGFKLYPEQQEFSGSLQKRLQEKDFIFPDLEVVSPLALCLVTYDNALREKVEQSLQNLEHTLSVKVEETVAAMAATYQQSRDLIERIRGWEYRAAQSETFRPVTRALLSEMNESLGRTNSERFNNYRFHDPEELSPGNENASGKTVMQHLDTLKLYANFISKYEDNKDIPDHWVRELKTLLNLEFCNIRADMDQYSCTEREQNDASLKS